MFKFFKRLFGGGKRPASTGIKAGEVPTTTAALHLNVAPDSKQAVLRHLQRAAVCKIAIADDVPNVQEYVDELRTRTARLMLQGIDLPDSVDGIHKLIGEIE